jgi:hypothetical protein
MRRTPRLPPFARQLLSRIAPLLAAAGDTAAAEDLLTLLPANERDAIQLEIVAAQLRTGEISAAMRTATTIAEDNAQAAALLLVVQAQADSKTWREQCERGAYCSRASRVCASFDDSGKGTETSRKAW